MFDRVKKRSKKIGLPPGTLLYMGERTIEKEKIIIIDYNEEVYQKSEINKIESNLKEFNDSIIRWINIYGIGQVEVIETLGKQFNLHPLLLEDVLNPQQRPKIENFTNYLFVVLKILRWSKEDKKIISEQISFVLGKNYVISFNESNNDLFNPIVERISNSKGRIRVMGADYLIYALIDVIIDNYFIIIEKIGRRLDEIEEQLIEDPKTETLYAIHQIKRELIALRKLIWPSRAVINGLQREELFMNQATLIYLRDLYDHIISIVDTFENYRDVISSMLEIYLSSLSNKMNQIINVLTIISTIFIPLSFLAGLYGMNFLYMPELSHPWGYPILLIVMASIAISMFLFYKKKKWI
ncbi:MAG: magnesium/cobalt transporter CorA [Promethearchaeota archaeon]